jgi:hypothetical protein
LLWWLATSLSQQRPRFGTGAICLKFVVNKVTLERVSLCELQFYPISIIPSALLSAEGETDEAWESAKHNAVWEIGEHRMKKYFYIVFKWSYG